MKKKKEFDKTKFSKKEFNNKIEEARNGKFVSVTKDELKNRLGL